MMLRCDLLHLFIYASAAGFLAACMLSLLRRVKWAWLVYACAFAMSLSAVAWRTVQAGHAPMSNLFEVLLVLGALMFPLSVFGRRRLGVGGEAFDMLMGAVLLVPAGLVFTPDATPLSPMLRTPLFVPHVAAYVVAYVVLAKAGVQAIVLLFRGNSAPDEGLVERDIGVYRLVCLGFPALTAGLAMGSLWGLLAWGDYWNWDPKELWSLATWLAYVAYFHVRVLAGRRFPRLQAVVAVAGFAMVLITLLWANLGRIFAGLHSYA